LACLIGKKEPSFINLEGEKTQDSVTKGGGTRPRSILRIEKEKKREISRIVFRKMN